MAFLCQYILNINCLWKFLSNIVLFIAYLGFLMSWTVSIPIINSQTKFATLTPCCQCYRDVGPVQHGVEDPGVAAVEALHQQLGQRVRARRGGGARARGGEQGQPLLEWRYVLRNSQSCNFTSTGKLFSFCLSACLFLLAAGATLSEGPGARKTTLPSVLGVTSSGSAPVSRSGLRGCRTSLVPASSRASCSCSSWGARPLAAVSR